MEQRPIVFRARKKSDGKWIEGNYFLNLRKGKSHNIINRVTNEWHEIYRDSLQMMDYDGEFRDI